MSRLIDADELKDHLLHGYCTNTHIASKPDAYMLGWNDAIVAVVVCAPTVDAVEVVRCKDCVYQSGMDSDHYCYLDGRSAYDYNFCSWGKK